VTAAPDSRAPLVSRTVAGCRRRVLGRRRGDLKIHSPWSIDQG
jgi:hypothetical protein